LPLQGADLIAYEIGQYFEKSLHRSDIKPRWGFLEIIRMGYNDGRSPFVAYMGEESMREAQREFDMVRSHRNK
jgi:hypothetical protein